MADQTISPEEMQKLAANLAAKIVEEVHKTLVASAQGDAAQAIRGGGGPGYDCKGKAFTCGEYTCTGVVNCQGDFGCTLKFAGYWSY